MRAIARAAEKGEEDAASTAARVVRERNHACSGVRRERSRLSRGAMIVWFWRRRPSCVLAALCDAASSDPDGYEIDRMQNVFAGQASASVSSGVASLQDLGTVQREDVRASGNVSPEAGQVVVVRARDACRSPRRRSRRRRPRGGTRRQRPGWSGSCAAGEEPDLGITGFSCWSPPSSSVRLFSLQVTGISALQQGLPSNSPRRSSFSPIAAIISDRAAAPAGGRSRSTPSYGVPPRSRTSAPSRSVSQQPARMPHATGGWHSRRSAVRLARAAVSRRFSSGITAMAEGSGVHQGEPRFYPQREFRGAVLGVAGMTTGPVRVELDMTGPSGGGRRGMAEQDAFAGIMVRSARGSAARGTTAAEDARRGSSVHRPGGARPRVESSGAAAQHRRARPAQRRGARDGQRPVLNRTSGRPAPGRAAPIAASPTRWSRARSEPSLPPRRRGAGVNARRTFNCETAPCRSGGVLHDVHPYGVLAVNKSSANRAITVRRDRGCASARKNTTATSRLSALRQDGIDLPGSRRHVRPWPGGRPFDASVAIGQEIS